MERIIGNLITGFGLKVSVIGGAFFLAEQVYRTVAPVMAQIGKVL